MRINRYVLTAVILAMHGTGSQLTADDNTNPETIKALREQIEQLDQKLRVLERKSELQNEVTVEKAKTTPTVSVGTSGLQVRSGDSNFVFNLHGYVQADGRFGVGDSAGPYNDTLLMRRIRPIFDGTIYQKIDYKVMLEFASGTTATVNNDGFVQDAYVNVRFLPELQLQVGKMKVPVGLERLQSGANLLFVERGYPTALVPNRDVGVMLQGDLFDRRLNYQVGGFNGVGDGGSTDFQTFDQGMSGAARVFAQPFLGSGLQPLEGLGIGVAGTYGKLDGPLRTYVSPGQNPTFVYRVGVGANPNVVGDGQQWRLAPQAYYYWGPFGLFGEYTISSQNVIQSGGGPTAGATGTMLNKAWQVAGSWFLTGEKNSWKPVSPGKPLNFSETGGLGAVELVARVQGINIDDEAFPVFANPDVSINSAFSWGAGVNWILNRNLKFSVDYEQTQFKGGSLNPFTAQDEQIIMSRVQFSF
jgi:phosphate-selective porin OprO and OprP